MLHKKTNLNYLLNIYNEFCPSPLLSFPTPFFSILIVKNFNLNEFEDKCEDKTIAKEVSNREIGKQTGTHKRNKETVFDFNGTYYDEKNE